MRFDNLKLRFDGLKSRFDDLKLRFDDLKSGFGDLEMRFDGLKSRFDDLESRFEDLKLGFEDVNSRFDDRKLGFTDLEYRVRCRPLPAVDPVEPLPDRPADARHVPLQVGHVGDGELLREVQLDELLDGDALLLGELVNSVTSHLPTSLLRRMSAPATAQ